MSEEINYTYTRFKSINNLTTFKTSLYLLITWRKLCYQKTTKNTLK